MANSEENSARRYKYYEVLEIGKGATQEEIRKAFRRLAQKYHPDHNPGNSAAEAEFKRINRAYQVLSRPIERTAYDSSPAECPVCWTHQVTEAAVGHWRCRHCACQFDVSGFPLSEIIERAAIPGRHRARLTAFQSMQCSWCRRFFTQPFLCPDRKLHSGCLLLDRLAEEERERLINDERWWWRMVDLIRWTENNGVLKKCVHCGAFNPNPKKSTCWNCGRSIYDRCPSCGLPTLHFDIDSNLWMCAAAGCGGKRFAFENRVARHRQYGQSDEDARQGVFNSECPKCGRHLRFDSAMLFWRCTNRKCRGTYTYDELRVAPTTDKPAKKRRVDRARPSTIPTASRSSCLATVLLSMLAIALVFVCATLQPLTLHNDGVMALVETDQAVIVSSESADAKSVAPSSVGGRQPKVGASVPRITSWVHQEDLLSEDNVAMLNGDVQMGSSYRQGRE